MTDNLKSNKKRNINLRVNSLRLQLLAVIIFAIIIGVGIGFITRFVVLNWIENDYNSEESTRLRHDTYIRNLQAYVDKNELLSEDTDLVFKWINRNTRAYIFLYKDGKLFLDNVDKTKDEDEDVNQGGFVEGEDFLLPNAAPTREEMLEEAEKLGLLPIEFADGTLLVSLYDNSERYFRNFTSISSILIGFFFFALILMFYFSSLTSKMHRLARDVSVVYESDMNHRIRTDKGADELSALGRTVEKMRVSMLENIEKKNEALNANTELITSLSHDIRTPLTVLLGYIDIMKENADETTLEYLLAAEATAIRLKELSDDMFRYFLVLGSHDKTEIAEYPADTVIRQMISEHVFLLEEKKYRVECDISIPENLSVYIDPSSLARVFENIFSNIYKYADKEKPITMRAVCENNQICVVAENYISDQSDRAESNRIGIKTINKLCELMGAKFEYGVRSEGDGSVFFTKLTLNAEEEKK